MFTGIIEDLGQVERVQTGPQGGRILTVATRFDPTSLHVGDSIATNGVCLTMTRLSGQTFEADAGPTTIERTTIGKLAAGQKVNLERAVTPTTRLGGHIVAGHVDGIGRVVQVRPNENAYTVEIEAPLDVLGLTIARGSVAVDGISLTVASRTDRTFSIMVIPHTWRSTTMQQLSAGASVNIEIDLIARYVAGLVQGYRAAAEPSPGEPRGRLTETFLAEHGFVNHGASSDE
ncbi:MAG: riboflavin synthase [Deltaproteobacteria bacterium]|nr:riboflavin synthase [Deltaproteobacteria bacterium]